MAELIAGALLVALLVWRKSILECLTPFEEPWRIRRGPRDGME